VVAVHNGRAALDAWRNRSPDLIILDLNLPGRRLEVCRRIREQDDVPIIILSVRGDDDDVVRGLELGADDYVPKPFSPRQLVARAQAVLRRAGVTQTAGPLVAGDLTLDLTRRELIRSGQVLAQLTALECRLMEVLMLNVGQVLPSDTLITQVWGPAGGDRTMLKQLVHRLRAKIEPDPDEPPYLETVPGVGYALIKRPSS
jgi:DNA-binding response OmpR family regulator